MGIKWLEHGVAGAFCEHKVAENLSVSSTALLPIFKWCEPVRCPCCLHIKGWRERALRFTRRVKTSHAIRHVSKGFHLHNVNSRVSYSYIIAYLHHSLSHPES